MKIIPIVLILFISSVSFAGDKKWIGTNSGHITKHRTVRRGTLRELPKPKFVPYPNVYWTDGQGGKYHLGEYSTERNRGRK